MVADRDLLNEELAAFKDWAMDEKGSPSSDWSIGKWPFSVEAAEPPAGGPA